MILPLILLLAARPFWESRAPSEWTDKQLQELLSKSPWAQPVLGPSKDGDGMVAHLATAKPIRDAEEELLRRASLKGKTERTEEDEFRLFLREHGREHIVLAVPFTRPEILSDPAESAAMQNDCVLKVGRKKYKMTGHFPPTAADPYLRLVFPRAVTSDDKSFKFELYLPGASPAFRQVEFRVTELDYKGSPEM